MRVRKKPLGDRNIIGTRVVERRMKMGMLQIDLMRRLQTRGIDLSASTLSQLEGQKRPVSDIELDVLADILEVSADWLLGRE